jgi:hypothetical protein
MNMSVPSLLSGRLLLAPLAAMLFATVADADPPALHATADSLAGLKEEIAKLPAAADLKRAAMEWAIAESERLAADKSKPTNEQRADALAADLARMMAAPNLLETRVPPKSYFPEIRDMEHNPGAEGLFDIKPYREVSPTNPKKRDRKPGLSDADSVILAYALLHPQSPAKGDPQALRALLTSLNQAWCVRGPSPWSEANALKALILLEAVYPNLVPPSVKAAWHQEIRTRGDKEIADYGKLFDENYVSRSWLNGDVRNTLNVGYRGIILNDPAYAQWTANAVKCMVRTLQPDGATNYTGYQNEGGMYHDPAINAMAWWWLFSGDLAARDFVIRSAPFYPLVSHRFVCEEYTCPAQKHYYNGLRPSLPFPGYLARDPYAVAACLRNAKRHLDAFFYDPGLPVVQPPDNYTLFDRNIIGPRGRYGNLDFALSTRDFSYYPGKTNPVSRTPAKGFGVTTILGMRIMNPPELEASQRNWPMNAVAEYILNYVKIGKFEFNKGELLESSVSMAHAAAAVSVKYMTSGRLGQNQNWGPVPFANIQAWIVNGERAVGLMRITATEAVKDARMSTMFQFVSGRAPWGVRKELVSTGKWEHAYGDLRLRVLETSYKDFELNYVKGGMMGNDNMRALLRFVEEPEVGDKRRDYAAGDSNWCLVELRPASSAPADSIKPLRAGPGLTAFTYTAAGKSYTLVHNPGAVPAAANFDMPPSFVAYSIHLGTDGSVDRDKYLNMSNFLKSGARDSGAKTIPNPGRHVSFNIPPKRHILVIGSNDPADHASGMKFYQDVFTLPDH